MNWEAVGAIGEVVGAFGVIVSLVYLALQVRQNSIVTRSATRQAISTMTIEWGLRVAESPDLRAVMSRWWVRDGEGPTSEDEILDGMLRLALYRSYENQYHQYKYGTFDIQQWKAYLEGMRLNILTSGGRRFWELTRGHFSSDFADFVDREIIGSGDRRPLDRTS